MKILKYIVYALVALLIGGYGFVFAQANSESVSVDLLALQLSGPMANFLIGALVLGGVLGMLASVGVMISLKTSQVRSARKVKKIEKEMSKLKPSGAPAV